MTPQAQFEAWFLAEHEEKHLVLEDAYLAGYAQGQQAQRERDAIAVRGLPVTTASCCRHVEQFQEKAVALLCTLPGAHPA